MITVTISGKPAPGQDKIARSIYEALVGSRHIVRFFNEKPSEIPPSEDYIIHVIDETKETK